MKTSKIVPGSKNAGTLIKDSHSVVNLEDRKVCFSFEVFKGDSVKLSDYNNYYFNLESSRNAVADFFDMLQQMSSLTVRQLFEPSQKKELHINKLDDDYLVDRIEEVLINGYLFPKKKVEQFEKEYFEFQISDGKRVICHRVDNIIYPLFIDSNHMICRESSRSIKAKMNFHVKSSFVKQSREDLFLDERVLKDVIKYIVAESEDDDFKKEDIIDILKECL